MRTALIYGLLSVSALFYCVCASGPKKAEPATDRPFERAPILIENVKPIYPPEAAAANITGVVWIKVLVDTLGVIRETMIIREQGENIDVFAQSAIDAALKCKWKPAISDGKPIGVWVTYRVDFDFK